MRYLAMLSSLALISSVVGQETTPSGFQSDNRCSSVVVPPIVTFRGRQYDEIPDVLSPTMRLANVLLSSGCRDEAHALVEALLTERPNDPDGLYVLSRWTWVTQGGGAAEELLQRMITTYPNFASARVLLAGLRIGQHRLDEATAILDEIEPFAQNDIWVYMDRIRIEALTAPSDEVRETLLAVLRTREFPPNVRLTAADQILHTRDATAEQVEASYRVPLDLVVGRGLDCRLSQYALWMMEGEGRYEEARDVLESYLRPNMACSGMVRSPMLLGYAYLVAAADVAPYPVAGNAAYLARADELLEGNYAELASWLEGRPQESKVRSFILPKLPVDAVDRWGATKICRAIQQFNADSVRAELDRGADPDGLCGDRPLEAYIRLMVTRSHVAERQAMLRLLLEYGATVGNISGCASPSEGDCGTVLLPIYQAFGFGR